MGRALFSQIYASAPAVRTEPEPTIERWGDCNRFDPDSEEFFESAQYEAFIDPAEYQSSQAQPPVIESRSVSSASSESSVDDNSSSDTPMAIGSDDPAIMIADAYSWQRRRRDTDSERLRIRTDRDAPVLRSVPIDRFPVMTSVPVVIPTPSPRNAASSDIQEATSPRSPTLRRTVNITPINIPIEPSTPSPVSPRSPVTPPPQMYQQSPLMFTPSPAPTVTPRIYSWQTHSHLVIPASPTITREGPLTNPRARMSFARLDDAPARIRIQNTVM